MFAVRPTAITPGACVSVRGSAVGCHWQKALLPRNQLTPRNVFSRIQSISLTIPEAVESSSPFRVCTCQVMSWGWDGWNFSRVSGNGGNGVALYISAAHVPETLGQCEGFS